MGDDGIVFPTVHFDCIFRTWIRSQHFVTDLCRIGPFGVGILRGKILRYLDSIQRISIMILLRRLPGIMRRIEGEIHEEGFIGLARDTHEVLCVIRHDFAPVLAARPESLELWIRRRPWVRLSFNRPIISLWIENRPRHSGTYMRNMVKNGSGVGFHMPLARKKRFVAGIAHQLRPHPIVAYLLGQIRLQIPSSPKEAARIDHRSAGDANRPMPPSHIVGMGKRGSLIGQSVEVGSINVSMPESPYRLVALIICENEKYIRFFG